jgi:hypothetical protein
MIWRGVTIDRLRMVGQPIARWEILGVCRLMPEMTAMIAQVANLRVAPIGSIGGNLRSVDSHSGLVALLIAVGTSKLCRGDDNGSAGEGSGGESSAGATGPINGAAHSRFRASPVPRRAGCVPLRAVDRQGPDHLRRLAHVHSFRALSEGCCVARADI